MKRLSMRPIGLVAALAVLLGAAGVAQAYVGIPRVGGLNGTGPTAPLVTSIYTNPAAIGQLRGYHFFIDVTPSVSAARFSRAGTDPATGEGYEEVGFMTISPVPFLGFTTDFGRRDLTFGVAAYVPFGRESLWPDDGAQRYELTVMNLKDYYLTPALAYNIGDTLMIGAGFSVVFSRFMSVCSYDVATMFYDLASDLLGFKFPVGTVPYQSEEWEATIEVEGSGFSYGWNVGVLFKPFDWLDVGVSYTSHVHRTVTGDFYMELPTDSFNLFGLIELERGVQSLLEDVAGIPTPNRIKGDVTTGTTLPQNVTFGVTVRAGDVVALDLAARWVDWSQYRSLRLEFDPTNTDLDLPTERVYFKNVPAWGFSGLLRLRFTEDLVWGIGLMYENDSIPERWNSAANLNSRKIDAMTYFNWRISSRFSWGLGFSHVHFFEKRVHYSQVGTTQSAAGRYLAYSTRLGLHFDVNW